MQTAASGGRSLRFSARTSARGTQREAGDARRKATHDDLLAIPDHLVAEIVDGELYTSPRPAMPHAHVSSTLGMDLGGPFQRGRGGPGGWWILDEPELHLGEDVLVPDLAGWRKERLPHIPDAAATELAPDCVCEVLSPRTASLDRVRKMAVYAAAGVPHAWLVDPSARTLEVYRLVDRVWLRVSAHAGEERVRAEPFDAVELDLGEWWISPISPLG